MYPGFSAGYMGFSTLTPDQNANPGPSCSAARSACRQRAAQHMLGHPSNGKPAATVQRSKHNMCITHDEQYHASPCPGELGCAVPSLRSRSTSVELSNLPKSSLPASSQSRELSPQRTCCETWQQPARAGRAHSQQSCLPLYFSGGFLSILAHRQAPAKSVHFPSLVCQPPGFWHLSSLQNTSLASAETACGWYLDSRLRPAAS